MENPEPEYVKASELIAALKAGGHVAEVVDVGDLHPYLSDVNVCIDEATHHFTLDGVYSYHEESVRHGIEPGRSEVEVLGVTFGRQILDMMDSEIEIDGWIEYDGDLTEADVLAAAEEGITFVDYDPETFPFLEDRVTNDEFAERLKWSMNDEVFVRGEDGEMYAYETADELPKGAKVIPREVVIKVLAKERPRIKYRAYFESGD